MTTGRASTIARGAALLASALLVPSLLVVACNGNAPPATAPDLAVAADSAPAIDLATAPGDGGDDAGACRPDPMTDGTPCSGGCATGTIAITDNDGQCRCYGSCPGAQVGQPGTCVCGHSCRALYVQQGDMGFVPNGMGVCVPTNGPAERCGSDDAGKPLYGAGACGDGLVCVNAVGSATAAYCEYKCTGGASLCPKGTSCAKLTNSADSVCVIDSSSGGKALGAACALGDDCVTGAACDGATCRSECDGPKDTKTCTGGTACTAVVDPATSRIAAYVCK